MDGDKDVSVEMLRGVHVLLVDDDKDTLELLETILRYCGALVVTVPSARAAMKALATVKPDVLVTDLGMPEEDGYWLLAEVRKLPAEHGGRMPAIAVTGQTREHGEHRVRAAGFDAYVPKPVEPWPFCRTIVSVIASR